MNARAKLEILMIECTLKRLATSSLPLFALAAGGEEEIAAS
jgi:hypothetical protein